MLGTLAKWLRILGFDTYFANSEISDEELIDIAKKENRIIISRDKELIQKCKKQKIEVIEIKELNLDKQLNQALNSLEIDKKMILTRCTLCNSIIQKISKDKVEGKVPEKVFEHNDKFWVCLRCKKYYWMGSHYDKIFRKIEEITS